MVAMPAARPMATSNSVSPTMTARSGRDAGFGEGGEQHRGMRLRGMVVGGLRGGDEVRPRPCAARMWSSPRRALPVATPISVPGRAASRSSAAARAGIERRDAVAGLAPLGEARRGSARRAPRPRPPRQVRRRALAIACGQREADDRECRLPLRQRQAGAAEGEAAWRRGCGAGCRRGCRRRRRPRGSGRSSGGLACRRRERARRDRRRGAETAGAAVASGRPIST